jgi:hypothetical protein
MAKHEYLSSTKIDLARELMASRNWQDSDQTSFVERIAVLMVTIDFAQGRIELTGEAAAVIDDSHIGSGSSGYSDSDRIALLLEFLLAKEDAAAVTAHGTRYGVLYGPLTAAGLDRLIEWLQAQPEREVPSPISPADDSRHQHPNVKRALKVAGVVTAEDRAAVMAHAHFRMNVSGGRVSDWIAAAADALRRAGSAQALRQQDAEDAQKLNERMAAWR